MRPIEKGVAPREYANYQDACPDLKDAIGNYCCYCERLIPVCLAVEHMRPKANHPEEELVWENFLLACPNCNSRKGNMEVSLADFLWPDTDNTIRAFKYSEGGLVDVHDQLCPLLHAKAFAMIKLVGLDVNPGHEDHKRRPTSADDRWETRRDIWKLAVKSKKMLHEHDTASMRDYLIDVAKTRGGFSIWMKVFETDSDIRLRLIRAFLGTAVDCFNEHGAPLPRTGGQC